MNQSLDIYKPLLQLCGLLAILIFVSSCEPERKFDGDLSYYLPAEAELIVRTYDPLDLISELENNSFLSSLKTTDRLPGLSAQLDKFRVLNPQGETWMALCEVNDTTTGLILITNRPKTELQDSIGPQQPTRTKINEQNQIRALATPGDSIFTVTIGDVLVASNFKKSLESTLKGPGIQMPLFNRLSGSMGTQKAAVFLRSGLEAEGANSNSEMDSLATSESSWAGLSLDLQPDAFGFNAITKVVDSNSVWRQNNFGPTQGLSAEEIAPAQTEFLIQRTYKRSDSLVQIDNPGLLELLLENSSSYGYFESSAGEAFYLKAIDSISYQELLEPYGQQLVDYKNIQRYTLTDTLLFNELLRPWAKKLTPTGYFKLDDYFVFTDADATAESIINNYRLKNTLATQLDYQHIYSRLSSSAHLRITGTPEALLPYLSDDNNGVFGAEADLSGNQTHKVFTLQFTKENDLVYLQGQTVQPQSGSVATGIRELHSISLDTPPLNEPSWFSNHRTRGKDIVYQDIQNQLHLLAYNGKSLWKRNLEGPILGKIHEVDLLRNGKKQLAFCTAKKLYIIDRNGKDVGAFPISFKDEVSLPLAVFDYDNNRKYRFVVVQQDEVLMYDSKAQIVKGFTFTKAPAPLAMPPQHLRISNKDYLTFALTDGTLLIKSRVGKDRIKVDKRFEFGELPIFQEQGNFVFISGSDTKVNIDQRGRITQKNLGVAEGFSLLISGKTKVSLDENLLRINGRLYELPFGVYSPPKIYQIGRKRFISLTDLQEKQVYVFDTSGSLLPNFPVYGTQQAAIGDANRNRRPNLLTLTDSQTLTIYEF